MPNHNKRKEAAKETFAYFGGQTETCHVHVNAVTLEAVPYDIVNRDVFRNKG